MVAEFQPPPRNMVQEVTNIIEAYKMGSLRALAQDPVQNSLDAYSGQGGAVRVKYELFERETDNGETIFLLTVTDSNTTGLRGEPLSLADLRERAEATGFLELAQDENWAAWEAMGYTKTGEDKLGSRGQGKAAFLYHSRRSLGLMGPGGVALEGMVMLYDTLLADGSYRLGVRVAQPADLVWFPPFSGDEAREVISSSYEGTDQGLFVPLGLEPLTETGTRVIVPFVSEEALTALRDGEMTRWLERCWWRAIQTGRLQISVAVDGNVSEVGVPPWWADQPWKEDPRAPNVFLRENIQVEADSPRRIKRVVLMCDDALSADEIAEISVPQYAGVQLLRGQQWIETLGTRERFGDYVPFEHRDGFRGFVEFDREIEAELREVESPQHDAFNRRRALVRQLDLVIAEQVHEFAEELGWVGPEDGRPQEDNLADDLLRRLSELFVSGGPKRGDGPEEAWSCQLDLEYPRPGTTRADWGESVTAISASSDHSPEGGRRNIRFDLLLIDPLGGRTLLESRENVSRNGSAGVDFRNLPIVKVGSGGHEAVCGMIGRYRLKVECFFEDGLVAGASRNIYVRMDPPEPPPERRISVEIDTRNGDTDRTRINSGEHLELDVVVKNRHPEPAELKVTASLGELLIYDDTALNLPARIPGDQPPNHTLTTTGIEIRTDAPSDPELNRVHLEPGKNTVRVDVKDAATGVVVANAARSIWVEVDPEDGGPELPFKLEARDPLVPSSIWDLIAPHGVEVDWVLEYTRTHPSFRAAQAADAVRDGQLVGRPYFFGEIICSALVEWALSLFREHGDESGFQLLLERAEDATGSLWEAYRTQLEELQDCGDEVQAVRLTRKIVSLMLYAVQEDFVTA